MILCLCKDNASFLVCFCIKITFDNKMKIEEHKIEYDCVLREWLKSKLSHRRITSLKRNGGMTVDGKPIRADQKIYRGQTLRLEFVEEREREFEPVDLGLKVVYSDDDVTVIEKGRGISPMPTVRHPNASVLNGMKFLFPDKTYRVVTRLDKDTEGLVLLANNAVTHSRLCDVNKLYVAVVRGVLKEKITVDAPIERGFGIERQIGGDTKCVSIISPLWSGKNYSLAIMQPITGRTHQLRLHSAHIGYPIVGDTLYGDGEGEYNSGQMLACVGLEFDHPLLRHKIKISLDEKTAEYLASAKALDENS